MKVTIATTKEDYAKVVLLRRKIFIEEARKFHEDDSRIADTLDDSPDVFNLLHMDDCGKPIGAMRLHISTGNTFKNLVEYMYSSSSSEYFKESKVYSQTSLLAIRRDSMTTRTLFNLTKAAISLWEIYGVTDIISTVNASHIKMWERIGFDPLGPVTYVSYVDDSVRLMHSPIENLKYWVSISERIDALCPVGKK